uniref:Putative zinc ion transmembrane transporter n=1 Tax=Corethrella appendiculata TaxID=1370023 RepID=U5EYW4_9DIPT
MSHKLMAVCVVCLICAKHLPCKEHVENSAFFGSNGDEQTTGSQQFQNIAASAIEFKQNIDGNNNDNHNNVYDKGKEKHKLIKRHTSHNSAEHNHHHHHSHEKHQLNNSGEKSGFELDLEEKINIFISKIFKEFGNVQSMSMNISGFEKMAKHLGLYHLINDEKSDILNSNTNNHYVDENVSCINSNEFLQRTTIPKLVETNNHKSSTNGNTSTSSMDKLKNILTVNKEDLLNICPIILYQITAETSLERGGCINSLNLPNKPEQLDSGVYSHTTDMDNFDTIDATVWIYSVIAVSGVSLCGLLGVAVIPCMEKHFYHHIIQFLVALAVGTLSGDALLHLLPHAMLDVSGNSNHDTMMFKGLAAVGGIVFFYFMERFLNVVGEWYKNKQKKDKPSSRVRVMRDPESNSLHNSSLTEKQCKHKYSSYPYCYDEIAMDTKDDHHEHNHITVGAVAAAAASSSINHHHSHNHHNHNHQNNHHNSLIGKTSDSCDADTANNKDDLLDNNTISTNLDDASIESEQLNQQPSGKDSSSTKMLRSENYTIILREHETKHHGHSHHHGHVHSPPGSLSAVAWMVIMGDGLHNFTDGMAIGAAFSNNIAGGFSTAIAVFCHELPHELGDFAVLLKAGMSARQAVYYNLLSSILSFIGMFIGIFIGHQPEASSWVFAVAAGTFLYIALVDMIPELTSSHGAENRCKKSEFLLQFLGMSTGFGVMLLIALYEHDLKEMFID